MGTPPCLSGPEFGGHATTYIPMARGSPGRIAKIRLVDTNDGGKSPSDFRLDLPHSAARHIASQHNLNNLNPVSGVSSS